MCKILRRNKFHLHKISLVKKLNENDFDRRLEFYELMVERVDVEPNFFTT